MAWHPFRNAGLKAAALGLGTLLWITVSGQQVERSTVVQLQFRNVPASLEMTGDTPPTVNVRLSGASGQISALEPSQVVATLDLTDARPGPRVFPLTSDQISVPLGIEVKSVDPSTVSVTLEPSKTAEIPVTATIDGEPAPGYDVVEVICEPRTATVIGPESRLKDRANLAAITERVSIEDAKSTVTESVSLGTTDSLVRLRDVRPVRVTIKIGLAAPTKLANRALTFRNLPPGRQASSDPGAVAVTLRARRDVIANLGDADVVPYVDVAQRAPGRYTLPVHVDAGDYIVADIQPATVTVRIR